MIFYDAQRKRLAIFDHQANPKFWDEQWEKEDIRKRFYSGKTHHFIKKMTKRYVTKGGKILEGGCGTGEVVCCLRQWGYDAYGIDFAQKTISVVKEIHPELPVFVQDVRQTQFVDNTFDAYWSLGVIEHFWNGYDDILNEAYRILKPEGVLFLTFPVVSPLRKLKIKLHLYPSFKSTVSLQNFYEFMLEEQSVTRASQSIGFEHVSSYR